MKLRGNVLETPRNNGRGVSTVKIDIHAKNLDLNRSSEEYIHKKIGGLRRRLPRMDGAKMEVSRTTSRAADERFRAQMTLDVGGYTLRGQDTASTLFAAVDSVSDIVDGQVRRFRGKMRRGARGRRAAVADGFAPPRADVPQPAANGADADADADEELGAIARTKRFEMSPMSVEDAILQMEMLGHGFFLFFNMDTDEYNVAYRRRDGDYGIIEPELV